MIVSETLQRDGFEVLTAGDGEDGLKKFTRHGADLIIADVMMPRMDGFEMGRRIRQIDRNVPLLFLTAKSEIDDIVEGFELGGNDYLKKPFKMLELIVRIKALLRRNVRKEDNQFEIGEYTLDLSTQILWHKDNGGIELSLIEAKLLRELIVNMGHTVDASTMMQLIWQRNDPYSRNSLHGFIHKLRHYLRYDTSISLLNQRGIGYMLTIR
ncbi:MAG: response regulator transcription factor [Barnesiella sp.]|nr:response regulator transcription factor [Barnesiella sp.]